MKSINLLYLGYWSAHDGLSEATILPHLRVLDSFPEVEKIIYVSIERTPDTKLVDWPIKKLNHIPYLSGPSLKNKILELFKLPSFLGKLCNQHKIDKIIARSTPAGTFAYLTAKKCRLPFYVESFEPHAKYMLATGVWSIFDPRYWLQLYYENKQKKHASALMPVAENYAKELREGHKIKCPIYTIPCTVDLEKFKPDKEKGLAVRQKLGFSAEDTVGIYVGKFGDIYFDEEAFDWFGQCYKALSNFKLIILTGQEKQKITTRLIKAGFNHQDFFVDKVPHHEVPAYLNAADFAFCLHKPHKYSHAYSPIKNGEYWACGLPTIIPENIGDDSAIVNESGSGIVVDNPKIPEKSLKQLSILLQKYDNEEIRKLAIRFRNSDRTKIVYSKI